MNAWTPGEAPAWQGPPPNSVLVIVTRRIGDVLLATPVLRSLKTAWPDAAVDVLAFRGTEGVLAENADVHQLHAVAERPGLASHIGFVLRRARRYDLALSLVPGDRPTLYAWAMGRRRCGLLLDTKKEAWKRRFLDRWVSYDTVDTHTVRMHLALVRALGLPVLGEVVLPAGGGNAQPPAAAFPVDRAARVAVLHVYPKFNYKMWREERWVELGRWLMDRGWRVALTGSGDAEEMDYVGRVGSRLGDAAVNFAGKLSLAEVAALLRRAQLYVGPDTAVTHMAAAAGMPTVALFGPTDPVKWGPWPAAHSTEHDPWRRVGDQRSGNVAIVQGRASCVPCNKEGCERHVRSFSDCLFGLTTDRVVAAINRLIPDERH